jgi:hypothetical protein
VIHPAFAIGRMVVRRHRRGLAAMTAWLTLMAAATAIAPAIVGEFAGLAWTLLIGGFCYLAAVFAYGFDTDLATPGTGFPTRMFTLPVRTAVLAGWPILTGVTVISGTWLAACGLLFRPWGLAAPYTWPALLLAAQLVVAQALLWWPFGLGGARILVGVLLGHLPASGTIYLSQTGHPIDDVYKFLAVVILLGIGFAYTGVSRARQGIVPTWTRAKRAGNVEPRTGRPFRSAAHAQTWFEARRRGNVVPFVCLSVLAILLCMRAVGPEDPKSIGTVLVISIGLPVFLAGTTGAPAGRLNPWARDGYALSSFTGTRPVPTAALVGAGLRAAVRTTAVVWTLAGTAIALAFGLSPAAHTLGPAIRAWIDSHSTGEAVAAVIALTVGLPFLTWKRIVDQQVISLTGREWLIKGSSLAGVFVGFSAVMYCLWLLVNPQKYDTAQRWLPWALGTAVVAKLGLAGLAVRGLRRHRLVTDRTILVAVGLWALAFAVLTGCLFTLVPAEVVSHFSVACGVILMLPTARFAAAPLALHANRHR